MSSSIVYAVQQPMRLNRETDEFEPSMNLSPALDYGSIEFLMERKAHVINPRTLVETLREKLKDFSDADYLLLVGDPAGIGIATALAAEANRGRVKVLVWLGSVGRYKPLQLDFSHRI